MQEPAMRFSDTATPTRVAADPRQRALRRRVPAVVVEDLVKSYQGTEAVKGVALEVGEGEVFALLGPNGAGKTTIIEILEGFRKRDRGHVAVLGYDPADPGTSRQLRERVGVVLQELAVEPFLSVRQALTRNAGYYPNPRPVEEVLQLVGLAEKADDRVKSLSGGQQRRLDLGLGIVGNPSLLFLDEPTTGFDPSARRGAWEVVRALTGGGTTVLLTTHYMDEAEALADRVAVINAGRIVAEGAPESLGGRDVGESTIRFRLPSTPPSALPVPARLSDNGVYEIKTEKEIEVLAALTTWALREGVEVAGLTVERLTLEEIYLQLTGFEPHGEASPAIGGS
jgi:ABC-2 type transport system ATP-binding protein